jgi:hypothetical protein
VWGCQSVEETKQQRFVFGGGRPFSNGSREREREDDLAGSIQDCIALVVSVSVPEGGV